jgi:hypothetical protein
MTQYTEEILQELGHEDCRKTIRAFADTTEISHGVCQVILPKHLDMRHVAAKFVPGLLTKIKEAGCKSAC